MSLQHRHISTNGIRMHIAEQGEGPLVLLLHGFPESWYAWRHQIPALAAAGYRVVAPDQRGYGSTDRPDEVDRYTILHLVGDIVGLIHALGEESAVVVGHDWGAPVAWTTAQIRPDLVRGVVGISLPPYRHEPEPPMVAARKHFGDGFYMLQFLEPGVGEALVGGDDLKASFRTILTSADTGEDEAGYTVDESTPRPAPGERPLPDWLTEEDLAVFAEQFAASGFTGGLNWYRNIDRSWELTAPWKDVPITPPALYMIGDRDNVHGFVPVPTLEELRTRAPAARARIDVPNCGHWTTQEQPTAVTDGILGFLRDLPTP